MVGSGRFGGRNTASFGRGGSQGRGFGYRRYGYDRFGYGGYGGNDLWFLGDLFGLALDFGRFAWSPWAPLGLVGLNLLDTGIQALDNSDTNNQQSYAGDQQSYAPLCGTYYSEENPGCSQ
jgi:hypothetical protein